MEPKKSIASAGRESRPAPTVARVSADGDKIPADYFRPIVIENIVPELDGGTFPVKWIAGRPLPVQADIYKEGHDILGAAIKFREKSESRWREAPMATLVNDRWEGSFVPEKNSRYFYCVEAWFDLIRTWLVHVEKKAPHNLAIVSETDEGIGLLKRLREILSKTDAERLAPWIGKLEKSEGVSEEVLRIVKNTEFTSIVEKVPLKSLEVSSPPLELIVDRPAAEYGAWYEFFPRSQGRDPEKSGTFKDCIRRLPEIKKMGFQVLYLPPIHPIGTTNRKGPNNTLNADEHSPGSPWAIGNKEGGHKSIHPALGTMADFEEFVKEAAKHGMEIALDYALQCSPDHPYVKEHPEWFYHLPDGSIRFAENPPKKYEDIYPLDFMCADREAMWEEMKSILLFWIEKGVKIFRVDNPHTKPLRFWQWIIRDVQDRHPDVLFLAEAFTRPKVMQFLAKAGFTQSYTYFTWRNHKGEIRQYLEELTRSEMKYYFRGNFFANTPDILSEILQKGGRPAFKMRLVLAATLSSVYGIYSGYELCENTPLREGTEDYLDSEKYQYKVRDWDRPGNIKEFIGLVNGARKENPALQQYTNLEFLGTRNDQMLAYMKWNNDKSNVVIVAVNLDPHHVQEDLLHFPGWQFGIQDWQTFQVRDLITGDKFHWKGQHHYIRLDPNVEPAHIFLLNR